jgi:hypothetical protein
MNMNMSGNMNENGRQTRPPRLTAGTLGGAAAGAKTRLGDGHQPPPQQPHCAIAIPVGLHFPDGACACGTATSIGPHGMFVETHQRPKREGCVDVRLMARCTEGERGIRLPSLILYRTAEGVGLLFRRLDAQAQDALRRLLRASSPIRPPIRPNAVADATLRQVSRSHHSADHVPNPAQTEADAVQPRHY